MPFGGPIIALSLLDPDSGDDRDQNVESEEMLAYIVSRIVAFEYSDHSRKKDQCKMTFENSDYRLFDRTVFAKGQKLLGTWGWPGRTAPPRRMIVQSVKGGEQMVVTCHCTLSLMDKKKRARFAPGVTRSEWVRAIADEYRYTGQLAHIEVTNVRYDITQPAWCTDAKMVSWLAQREGFEFYIDATGFHWHRRATDSAPVHDYIYRRDPGVGEIISPPSFEANLTKGITRVKVVGRDPLRKTFVDQSAGLKDEQDVSLGHEDEMFDPEDDEPGLRGNRIGEEQWLPVGLTTDEDALARASGMYRETAQGRYKMKMEVIGDPRVGAKNIIGLWGDVSDTMSGLYYVAEAVHKIKAGAYTMELSCEKDALHEVKAAKKRPPRTRTNQTKKKGDDLDIMLTTITLPSGEIVPAFLWTEDGGKTGITSQLTEGEVNQLTDYQKEQLRYNAGAVSYPDP